MKYPSFVSNEFIDQNALNNAFGTVSGAVAGLGAVTLSPGLYRPDAIVFSSAGLTLTSVLNLPFAVVFGTGDYVNAHGIVTNADTQTYSTSFSGVVPGSGSVIAYLLASNSSIQQGSYQVVGPPPGHPDYNPAFAPFTAYAQNVETLLLQASTTPPDNLTTFELCRFTLATGASGLATPNTAFQNRAGASTTYQGVICNANTSVPTSGAGQVYNAVSGLTFSLPAASGANENWYGFLSSTSGAVNVQVVGTDSIFGTVGNPTSGITIMALPQGSYTALAAVATPTGTNWNVVASSQYGITASGVAYIAAVVSGFVKFTGATQTPFMNFAGISGSPQLSFASGGSVPTVTVSGGVPSSGFNPGITGALYIN